tara:strand:+ start:2072 stop:2344 length:273 start_codon:yes stop_codon:yes gene_type:complete
MQDLERRLIQVEEKLKSEVGDDKDDGQVWRVVNDHTARLAKLDDMIWRGNGDSITAQIIKLRTELRTIAICVSVLIPIIMKVVDAWLEKI